MLILQKYFKCKQAGTHRWLSEVKVAQLYPTLCDPMNCIVNGILQARILEWVTFSFSRVSSQLRDQTQVSHIAGGFFISWAIREAQVGQTMACSECQRHNHRSVKSAMNFWHQSKRNVFRFDYPCVDSILCVTLSAKTVWWKNINIATQGL